MAHIWNSLPQPFFVLAPMEAVTDVVFRHVIAKAGTPDVFFTEFTNATGWLHAGDKAIGGRLIKTDDEHPIVAQLWGSEPSAIEALSCHCKALGYDGIDINMGCPDKSALKSGGGAQMIRTPELAYATISAAKASGLPVSIKTRLGYSQIDEWHEWLRGLLEQDIAALTIHLRTKKEMSKVAAHHDLIPEIKTLRDSVAPHTKLIINGDIRDRDHGMQLYQQHGIDGIMIGRGIFHNPFCFAEPSSLVDKPALNQEVDSLFELLRYHLDLYDQYGKLTGRPYETLKRFYKIYVRDFDGASELRDKLMNTTSTNEVRAILSSLFLKDSDAHTRAT